MFRARSSRFSAVLLVAHLAAIGGSAQEVPTPPEPAKGVHILVRSTFDRVESDGTLTRRERFRAEILTASGLAMLSAISLRL